MLRKSIKMNKIQVLDAGNTRIKLAVFENDTLLTVHFFDDRNSLYDFIDGDSKIVLSSVIDASFLEKLKDKASSVFQIDTKIQLPFNLNYKTPETLGFDRICNIAAINFLQPSGNRLCVDIGTCIKFDILDEHQNYLGGSISPGLKLRYKALNSFTAKLPLLEPTNFVSLIGDSTATAIQSGVQLGMQAEINGIINRYQQNYHNLTIFITGGDAHYFDFEQKNNIFADENLTLKGIFELYKLNATHA